MNSIESNTNLILTKRKDSYITKEELQEITHIIREELQELTQVVKKLKRKISKKETVTINVKI